MGWVSTPNPPLVTPVSSNRKIEFFLHLIPLKWIVITRCYATDSKEIFIFPKTQYCKIMPDISTLIIEDNEFSHAPCS